MPMLQCNMEQCLFFSHYGRDSTLFVLASKPRTKSIPLAEDISHGFSIDPGQANDKVEADDI
ncbi:hypothetical protein ASG50_16135 [Rhizobium sp. Leaf386]|nr:hypothetical protein ASG50_16135 [Rhizobium sp. Leaf386]